VSNQILPNENFKASVERKHSPERILCEIMLKSGIWFLGVLFWLFGLSDRGIAAVADGYLTVTEVSHFLVASFLFVSWLYMKPEELASDSNLLALRRYGTISTSLQQKDLKLVETKMHDLNKRYITSQTHILPFPYFCQIYHLLNLKHLENIHSFSLGNLKIVEVSQIQLTHQGGRLKFKTVLNSPFNILRIWRQPIVEVELVLHNPYLIELKIPAYQSKEITVVFNVLPLSETEHKLFIDIYSDLGWPKPILRFVLNFAARLTLLEDLPYLRKLTERKLTPLVESNKNSTHQTMQLFQRFVDLYGASIELLQRQKIQNSFYIY
jgi:hypothetical protein